MTYEDQQLHDDLKDSLGSMSLKTTAKLKWKERKEGGMERWREEKWEGGMERGREGGRETKSKEGRKAGWLAG